MRPLDPFTTGYLECAIWIAPEDDNGKNLDDYSIYDIDEATLDRLAEECKDFQDANADALSDAYECDGYDASRAGHDFFLTRNRHGAGFWDRSLGAAGSKLTEAAHVYGEQNLYLNENGKIYSY